MAKIRTGGLVNLLEASMDQAGSGNERIAWDIAGDKIREQFELGNYQANDMSVYSIAEAALRAKGVKEGVRILKEMNTQRVAEELSSTAFPTLTKELINAQLIPKYQHFEGQVQDLYTSLESTNSEREYIGGLTEQEGLSYVPEKGTVEETDLGEKKVTVRLAKFQKSMSITKELIFNDQTGQIVDAARNVGKVAGQQMAKFIIETLVVKNRSLLPYESSTSDNYCAVFEDTQISQSNFYNTDHSAVSGIPGSVANANVLNDSLSTAGLDAARLLFTKMRNSRGDEIIVEPEILLVPEALRTTAWQLLNSTGQFDTTDNASNPFGAGGAYSYRPMASRYLDSISTAEWYLGDFMQQIVRLVWEDLNTVAQTNVSDAAFENDIVQRFKASMGFGAGHRDYVYIVKSNGTA